MSLEDTLKWAPIVTALVAGCPPPIEISAILAIIHIESRGDPGAINAKSMATGLMQIMPRESNPEIFGNRPTQKELLDPGTNIAWGIRILSHCLTKDPTLRGALYFYSGGAYWESPARYDAQYWLKFVRIRAQIKHQLLGLEKDDDGRL